MIITNLFFINSTQTKRVSITLSLFFRTHITNLSNKPILTKRPFHSKTSSELQNNGGFCFQDCVSLLQHLRNHKDINCGRTLHSLFVKSALDKDVFVQNNMVRFYGDIGEPENAHNLFDEIPHPSLVSWTSLISCYVHVGQYVKGLSLFCSLCQSGMRPNEFGFSVALKACRVMRDSVMGKLIHGLILKSGFDSHSFCCASILHMYADCGDIENSRKFFNGVCLSERCEALWNTLLNSYVRMSDVEGSVKLFREMGHSAMSPNCFTYTILVKLCADVLDFELGRSVHGHTVKIGIENDVVVGGALVDFYAKLGLLDDACKVFHILEERDNVSLCALLAGFNQIGKSKEGLSFYIDFLCKGNKPDPYICACVASLCSNLETELAGTQVHCGFIKHGFKMDSYLGSAFISMYGNFGMISDAYNCFLDVCNKNEICISAMMNSLILNSNDMKALELFCGMRGGGIAPSNSSISYVLRACGSLFMLKEGRSFHSYMIKNPYEDDYRLDLENALLEMYVRCRVIDDAKLVFETMKIRNEFTWTTIISGCSESGHFVEALGIFRDMLLYSKPSQFTLISVVQACAEIKALDVGKQVHSYVMKVGFEYYPFVGSALINMYGVFKHETLNAFQVFLSMKEKDLISWSVMLTSWVQNGYHEEALKLFAEFQAARILQVDESILSSCISAAAGLAALDIGKCFHSWAIKLGFEIDFHVASSITDMYSKCGNIKDACKFFNTIHDHNLISWTAMIYGYAYHGLGKEAIDLFNKAIEAGMEPDGVTFTGVLAACSHAGLVEEGCKHFEYMRSKYNSEVTINHYACMVDLLGRAAKLEEAEALIKEAPFHSKSLLWKTFLGACSKHENGEVGNRISKMLGDVELNEPSTYVLLSNIYASASMWKNCLELRNKMVEGSVNKQPGSSWIQLAG
ncbi:pentatricopeptide repeat-containing protein At2g33680-like [Gastrolobium bilobum]|uniref:pentatricopeptide repeat-containing protein At2g33680-like n=1 Tax=Gastrolobium bilobum TaxID=150636 RepID=UPI002AB21E6C|nr:pentatricopeptide repeat-containing protein At2g33680-like [Gastrolobium bilobum]